jgi:hypothetical protein
MTPTIQGVHWAPPTASSSQREFGSGETAALASYLARLGISHLYASPYLKARPGSTHGYGVTDHNALHPELGRRGRFRAHGAALRANGLGQILNVPPWSLCHHPSSGHRASARARQQPAVEGRAVALLVHAADSAADPAHSLGARQSARPLGPSLPPGRASPFLDFPPIGAA